MVNAIKLYNYQPPDRKRRALHVARPLGEQARDKVGPHARLRAQGGATFEEEHLRDKRAALMQGVTRVARSRRHGPAAPGPLRVHPGRGLVAHLQRADDDNVRLAVLVPGEGAQLRILRRRGGSTGQRGRLRAAWAGRGG